jgi:hypothetical protein
VLVWSMCHIAAVSEDASRWLALSSCTKDEWTEAQRYIGLEVLAYAGALSPSPWER